MKYKFIKTNKINSANPKNYKSRKSKQNKMKKIMTIIGIVLIAITIFTSCGSKSKDVDLCRCLAEPANSEYNQENNDACRDAISKKIGVDNWEKINFNQNPEAQAKWDKMILDCGKK